MIDYPLTNEELQNAIDSTAIHARECNKWDGRADHIRHLEKLYSIQAERARMFGQPYSFSLDGKLNPNESAFFGVDDLENIPQKRSGWVNIFSHDPPHKTDKRRVADEPVYPTKAGAESHGRGYGDYVTTTYIEWEE